MFVVVPINACSWLTFFFLKHLSHTQIINVTYFAECVKFRSHRKFNTYNKQILQDFMSNMDTNAMSHVWGGTSTLFIYYKDQSWMMIAPTVQSTSLQNVFRWTARCPSSSYSLFDTHIFLKVSRDARIEPPIQVEYKRSWGADIWNSNITVMFIMTFSCRTQVIQTTWGMKRTLTQLTLILMSFGANFRISDNSLSPKPWNI